MRWHEWVSEHEWIDHVVERLKNSVAFATDAGHRFASNVRIDDLTRLLDRLATFDAAYNERGVRLDAAIRERDELRAENERLRVALIEIRQVLYRWDRSALDGNHVGDDGPSVRAIIDEALPWA